MEVPDLSGDQVEVAIPGDVRQTPRALSNITGADAKEFLNNDLVPALMVAAATTTLATKKLLTSPAVQMARALIRYWKSSPTPVYLFRGKRGLGTISVESTALPGGNLRMFLHDIRAWDPRKGSLQGWPGWSDGPSNMGVATRGIAKMAKLAKQVAKKEGCTSSSFELYFEPANEGLYRSFFRPRFQELPTRILKDSDGLPFEAVGFRIPTAPSSSTSVSMFLLLQRARRPALTIKSKIYRSLSVLAPLMRLQTFCKETKLQAAVGADSKRRVSAQSTRGIVARTTARVLASSPSRYEQPPLLHHALSSRMVEAPRRQTEIHTAVVTQCTGTFPATSENLYRRSDGPIMFIAPDTGEHIPVTGTPPSHIVIRQLAPPPAVVPPPAPIQYGPFGIAWNDPPKDFGNLWLYV